MIAYWHLLAIVIQTHFEHTFQTSCRQTLVKRVNVSEIYTRYNYIINITVQVVELIPLAMLLSSVPSLTTNFCQQT